MKMFVVLLFVMVFFCAKGEVLFPGLTGSQLADSIVKYYKSSSNLGYDVGRDTLYGVIDKVSGYLTCVYSGYSIYMPAGEDPSTYAYNNDINCEHTWPQSLGAEGLAKADLHHLYPTEIDVNAARGNLPFGEIADNLTNRWYYNNSYITTIPASNKDLYSELYTNIRFEPREDHKGNASRSMFYFFTMYKAEYLSTDSDTSFWKEQRDTLFAWHYSDPVDSREDWRTDKIGSYQQNKPNPFVKDTTLSRRIYYPQMSIQEDFTLDSVKECESCAVYDINEKSVKFISGWNNLNAHIIVSDISGRNLVSSDMTSSSFSLKSLNSGVYFVKIIKDRRIVYKSKILMF